ncbi:MAG TPA: hypothetical protein VJ396_03090 [Acidiferrobacterales bacterium]|nr:hypothetical protein [Acidiferrobacterales bacterium]
MRTNIFVLLLMLVSGWSYAAEKNVTLAPIIPDCNPTGRGDVCQLTRKMVVSISAHKSDPRIPIYQITKVYANQNQMVTEMKLTTISSADRAMFSIRGAQIGQQDSFCNELKSGADYNGRSSNAAADYVKWAQLGGQSRMIVFFSDGVKAGEMISDVRGCQ